MMPLEFRHKKDVEEARRALLERLDRRILERIETRFGPYIPQEKMTEAKRLKVSFLSAQEYAEHLRSLGMDQTSNVLGDYTARKIHINYEDRYVPRTLVHERLHHLADEGFAKLCGSPLHEGFTERLAREVSPDLHIQGEGQAYGQAQRVVDLLWARAGRDALAKAYFRGDTRELKLQLEAQLGPNALERVLHEARLGNVAEAERLLRGG